MRLIFGAQKKFQKGTVWFPKPPDNLGFRNGGIFFDWYFCRGGPPNPLHLKKRIGWLRFFVF